MINMKSKRGASYLEENLVYIVVFIIFFLIAASFIYRYQDNSLFKEQYYSYSISKAIDSSRPGDRIEINMDKAVETARKGGIAKSSEIVSIDNEKKLIYVSLQNGKKTAYSFYRNYKVESLGISDGINGRILVLNIMEDKL